jgi:hypothetical protein
MTDTRAVETRKKSRTASTEKNAQAGKKTKLPTDAKAVAEREKKPAESDEKADPRKTLLPERTTLTKTAPASMASQTDARKPEQCKRQTKKTDKQGSSRAVPAPLVASSAPAASPANAAASAAASGSPLTDPAVIKLVEYAKEKKTLSIEELSDYLPDYISNTEKIEPVLALLESNNVQIIVDESSGEDEADIESAKNTETRKKRTAANDKESSLVDDPIRMYLREIGRENLLTAEQEIELSRQMEEGENIVKNVIKKSGMIIPEFYRICEEAFSKRDLRELNLTKKETTERLAERRRLISFYKDSLRTIQGDLKNYIEMKQRLIDRGLDYMEDKELVTRRRRVTHILKNAELHPDEILLFSEKFIQASKKIKRYKKE